MKETDDGKKVGVSDEGSIPSTSTTSWTLMKARWGPEKYSGEYWFGQKEWDTDLLTNDGGELDSTGRVELLQEDSDTKT